ncbi:MAG: TetR/AcrR family transcriptional regulator [Roseibium sp.]|uniref:TetR/AcrR family transcriptional regulator n=1 Tax=Roseibium sp. TaxID=1936156 RepID=UPI003D9C21C5
MPTIVRLFWRDGFDRLTLDQVASELGVTKPTVVRALGDKEGIFAKALDAYYQTHIRPGERLLETAPDFRSAIAGCFRTSIDRILNPDNPQGCFLTDVTLTGAFTEGPVARTIASIQDRTLELLQGRIQEAKASGELRVDAEPAAVLNYVLAQFAALSAVSRFPQTRSALEAVVDYMVAGLPWSQP